MFKKTFVFAVLMALCMPFTASAQYYGKNKVIWEKVTDNFYRTEHFDVYHWLDMSDPKQKEFLDWSANQLESSYEFLGTNLKHNLKHRPSVVMYRTHASFESSFIEPDFMPEGVGAYADPSRNRLVWKPDFLPVLNAEIITHELAHIFQFSLLRISLVNRVVAFDMPSWVIEGGADYLGELYNPLPRDDIRKMYKRTMAGNPEKYLPTLTHAEYNAENPYLMAMRFEFLEKTFGKEVPLKVMRDKLENPGRKLIEIITEATEGKIDGQASFDRMHRDFWAARYAKELLDRPRPYQDLEQYRGRFVVPKEYPYPMTSPAVMPAGNKLAVLTEQEKNGTVVMVIPALNRETVPWVKNDKKKRQPINPFAKDPTQPRVLNQYMPPRHFEYIVAQNIQTWPFNGSDLDAWQDPAWAQQTKDAQQAVTDFKQELVKRKEADKEAARTAPKGTPVKSQAEKTAQRAADDKEMARLEKVLAELNDAPNVNKVAFMARKKRDHALFIVDANTTKVLKSIEVPLDQAFSPAFSPDGKTVYFAAAKDIVRNIYSVDLETQEVKQVTTTGNFSSAPAVSPDGAKLAYIAFPPGSDFQKMFVQDLATGVSEQVTFNRFNDNSPSWSPDGKSLVYTSDEKDTIWNLYTYELDSRTVRQYTDFFGGVFTPKFASGENDRVYYTTWWEYDQYFGRIGPNYKVCDALLKKPVREYVMADKKEPMEFAFHPELAVHEKLDQAQLDNPEKPPRKWRLTGNGAVGGYSTYYGAFGYSSAEVSDILEQRHHYFVFAQSGSYFRVFNYSYVDVSKRRPWGVSLNSEKFPLYYLYYDLRKGTAQQPVLNQTYSSETSASFFTQYPLDKFNRVEFGATARKRKYDIYLADETKAALETQPDLFNPTQVDFYRFFRDSSSTSVGFASAFVHDTVLYSWNTMGPLNGEAVRAQIEYAPSVGSLTGYTSASLDARKYIRLANSVVWATRVAGVKTTRPTGDFVLMGGNGMLRGYPYGSLAGNNIFYAATELRIPLINALVFPGGIAVGPVRAFGFADYGVAKFSNGLYPAQKGTTYGFGAQFGYLNFSWAKRKLDNYTDLKYDFYIGYGF